MGIKQDRKGHLADANAATKLIQQYESIRLREYELINNLLDVLTKVHGVSPDNISQVRDALFHADHPYLMVFTGPFSAGKSSLINALLGTDLLRVGVTPTTDRISILRWGEEAQHMGTAGDVDTIFHPSERLRRVSFVDTPGLQSIFQQHEATTNKFLHRADVVLLVMLSTQAMSQANLQYMQRFKEYGKKIIFVVNQSDLLDEADKQTVKDYVSSQCRDRLGMEPEVWMVSAVQGMAAWQPDGTRNEQLWQQSGMHQIEQFIDKELHDSSRMRQKLQTPLQIVQNAHTNALSTLRGTQAQFDQYSSINANIDQQLAAQQREQKRTVREITQEIEQCFEETARRSGDALSEIFQFSRAFGSLRRGLTELIGISRLFRRADAPNYIEKAFSENKVFEPLDDLPDVAAKLAPRLEGKDMGDIDHLMKYAQREARGLPTELQARMVGKIDAPARYDRSHLQDVMPKLDEIQQEARVLETEKLDQTRRNTLLYLAVWEVVVLVLLVALLGNWGALDADALPISFILLIVLLGAGLLGFALMPLRGRSIHTAYTNNLMRIKTQYNDMLTKAADRQIDYAMQLRRNSVAPLTRLIETQTALHDEQYARMRTAEQEIAKIENDLNALGKRGLLGIKL